MSTRSRIGIKDADGTIRSIYCHSDGYLDWNGMKLFKFYDTEAKVKALVDLGDLAGVGEHIGPAPKTKPPLTPDEHVSYTAAYGRDRGEKDTAARLDAGEAMYLEDQEEFAYLWDTGAWYVWQMREKPPVKTRLVEALVIEKLES